MLKKIFRYALFATAFLFIVALAFPALLDSESAGRVEKKELINMPFLKNETASIVLVYFGYVGCLSVCEPSLKDIATIYSKYTHSNHGEKPAVLFVNMTTQIGLQNAALWAKSFHTDFKAYSPNKEELTLIVQKLGLIYSELGIKAEHTPYLYLFKKSDTGYELQYIYTTRPYNEAAILKDLKQFKELK